MTPFERMRSWADAYLGAAYRKLTPADRRAYSWPPWWLAPATVLAGFAAFIILVWQIVVPLLRLAGRAITDVMVSEVGQLILDPVHDYLYAHAGGLPLSLTGATLYEGWLIVGVIAWFTAVWFRNIGARVGWVLHGLSAAVMVWGGTSVDGRGIAVGVVAVLWCAVSAPALRRQWSHQRVAVVLPEGVSQVLAQVSRQLAAQQIRDAAREVRDAAGQETKKNDVEQEGEAGGR